jgi:hypothetical protein
MNRFARITISSLIFSSLISFSGCSNFNSTARRQKKAKSISRKVELKQKKLKKKNLEHAIIIQYRLKEMENKMSREGMNVLSKKIGETKARYEKIINEAD